VCHDMELVEQNARLRGVPGRRVLKCLPHVHHGQADEQEEVTELNLQRLGISTVVWATGYAFVSAL
jgi:hypothetical protein